MITRTISVCLFVMVSLACSVTPVAAQSSAEKTEGVAVSLRALRDEPGSADSHSLFGATKLLGFLFTEDDLGPDCILVLAKEPRRPGLRFDDLAVAYRNVAAGEARPACTIDPRRETLRTLSDIAQRIGSARDEQSILRHLREWEHVGKRAQDVQVFNVDAQTHFAGVMVKADYELKSLCNGEIQIPGITSLTDRLAQRVQADIARAGTTNMPLGSQNRFWFNPGRVTYQTGEGLILLSACEVKLLTEEEAVTHEGERAGRNQANPLAQEFANDLTQQFSALAQAKPIFRELESLYRTVAILVLMHGEADEHQRTLLGEALGSIDVAQTDFHPTLPGRVSVKTLQGKVANGTYVLRLPSCGGVSIEIDRDSMVREDDINGVVPLLANRITSSRPNQKAISWKISL
jgi:hypothetical protein